MGRKTIEHDLVTEQQQQKDSYGRAFSFLLAKIQRAEVLAHSIDVYSPK